MPSVPVYNQQVTTSATPTIRADVTAPIEAFGGGEIISNQTRAVNQAFDVANKEIDRANQVAVTGADTEAAQLKHKYYLELQGMKGENAFDAKEKLAAKYKEDLGKITSKLSGPSQIRAFDIRAKAHEADLEMQIDKHVFAESQEVDKQKTTASIQTYGNEALLKVDDTLGHETAINQQKQIYKDFAARNGMPKEYSDQEVAKLESKTRGETVERMLFADYDTKKVKAYIELNKDKFLPDDYKRIKERVDKIGVQSDAQKFVNQLLASGVSERQAFEEIRKVEDVALHDEIKTRFKDEIQIKEAQDKRWKDDTFNSFANTIEKNGGDLGSIQKTRQWEALDKNQKDSLLDWSGKLKRGEHIETDMETYYMLKRMSANDKTRAAFLRENILAYGNKLSRDDRTKFIDLQTEMQKGVGEKELNVRNTHSIIKQTAEVAGLDPKDNIEDIYKIERQVDEELDAMRGRGEKPTNDDVQKIADRLLTPVTIERKYWLNKKAKVYELNGEKRVYIDYEDIPNSEKVDIKTALRRQGIPVTNETITKEYMNRLERIKPNVE